MKMSAPYKKLEKPLDDNAMLCRCCLAGSGEMKNIFEWGLAEDFTKFTDVQLNRSENMSELLCTACEKKLETCKRFRSQCQKSDTVLKNAVKNNLTIDTPGNNENNAESSLENTISYILLEKKLLILLTAPDMDSKIYLLCPQCRSSRIKSKDLLTHMIRNHNIDNDFSIETKYYCSYTTCPYYVNSGKDSYFQYRKQLNQHYIKVHMKRIHSCDSCSLKFATVQELNRHYKTCEVKFPCQVCNIDYKTNERLLVHLLRKHPDLHKQYKEQKSMKRKAENDINSKKQKDDKLDFYDSPKRSLATQTLEDNIKNDVTFSWQPKSDKTDEISTQTVFEDLLSLKSQTSEDESIFFSETVSLSDIQTQTFPIEFGLTRSNKETITCETQSPDLSIKETQTCVCLYDSPRINYRLFDSISSPSSLTLTSTETQTLDMRSKIKSDVLLGYNSAETQTSFEEGLKDSL